MNIIDYRPSFHTLLGTLPRAAEAAALSLLEERLGSVPDDWQNRRKACTTRSSTALFMLNIKIKGSSS
jgi:hypothetical protein